MTDATMFTSAGCDGERCFCGAPAAYKVGEEIAHDDPSPHRHNLTSYVCGPHLRQIMGPIVPYPLPIPAPVDPDSLKLAVLALDQCRERFAEYAVSHHAEGTEDARQKAIRNESMVAMIDVAKATIGNQPAPVANEALERLKAAALLCGQDFDWKAEEELHDAALAYWSAENPHQETTEHTGDNSARAAGEKGETE